MHHTVLDIQPELISLSLVLCVYAPYTLFIHTDGTQNGNGATSFGASTDYSPPLSYDAEHNLMSAIVRWVEEGVAPESFVAAAYNDGSASNGLNYTRPICKVGVSILF